MDLHPYDIEHHDTTRHNSNLDDPKISKQNWP
jgi:hypothetical protein